MADFKSNLERWSQSNPNDSLRLATERNEHVQFQKNNDGSLNLLIKDQDSEFLCHQTASPEKEAQAWFSSLNLNNVQILFVCGIGLGYFYQAAAEWLHADPKRCLVFLEPNSGVISRFLETDLATQILNDKQIWLFLCDPKSPKIDDIANSFLLRRFAVTVLPAYSQHRLQEVNDLSARLSYFLHMRNVMVGEHMSVGAGVYRNIFKNFYLLPNSRPEEGLKGQFKGVPAIVVGAGPSLSKNLSLLKSLKNRALIFAGGTAVNCLDTIDLLPHFGLGVDPNPTHLTRMIMNRAYETPFFYKNRIYHEALNLIHGDRIFLNGCGGYPLATQIEQDLGLQGQILEEGFNVINLALSTARYLGCSPIIFVGLDLAYTGGASYPPGIKMHPLHNPKDHMRTKTSEEELVVKNDIYGQPTLTLWKWISESYWYTDFARNNLEVQLINCTEGGIGFPLIANSKLEDAAREFLDKEYDFDTWINGAIQNCVMPESVSTTHVEAVFENLKTGLKRSSDICKAIIENKEETKVLIHEMESISILSAMLEVYRSNYLDSQKNNTTDTLGLYKYLKTVFNTILKDIEEANEEFHLAHRFDILAEPEISPEKAFENLTVEVHDPSLQLEERRYPQGALMYRQYLKNQRLEGPVSYFSEKGQLLAWSHFSKGLKQGHAYSFYANGNLKYQGHFEDGIPNGHQRYYYANGAIKSDIPYIQGQLEGDLKLYYPAGQMKRELQFSNGKRHGFERIWNEQGQLIIEAKFDMGHPTGVARMWYEDGNEAVEVNYSEKVPVYKSWNRKGFQFTKDQGPQDYFEVIGQKTAKLTDTISEVVERVKEIIPLAGAEQDANIKDDLNEITQSLELFKKMSEMVESTYGPSKNSEKEVIWKTPSSKRIVESQVEGMTKALAESLKNVHESLENAIKIIEKKADQNEQK